MKAKDKLLRSKQNQQIYGYSQALLDGNRSMFDVVTAEEVYPEQFIPKARAGRKSKLALSTVQPKAPADMSPTDFLSNDASAGLE
jgi:hypothetical protein